MKELKLGEPKQSEEKQLYFDEDTLSSVYLVPAEQESQAGLTIICGGRAITMPIGAWHALGVRHNEECEETANRLRITDISQAYGTDCRGGCDT